MNNRLYYYCKLSTAIEKILPNKQILLNPVGKTNDPRENKNFVFASTNMFAGDYFLLKNRDNSISDEIRKDCKMICFSTDYRHFFGYEYSRMWALYGENHKGICIELNKEKFILENQIKILPGMFKEMDYYEFDIDKPLIHKSIDFDRIRDIGLEKYIRNEFRPNNIDYLFFTKNYEWESEHEFRLIYFSDLIENEYCGINTCIESIFLGIDFNENYLPSINEKVPDINIESLDFKGVRLVPKIKT